MKETNKLYWQFAGSLLLVSFVILGYLVKFYEATILPIDNFFNQLIRSNLTDTKTNFFLWITKFGNVATIAFLLIVFVYLLWRSEHYPEMIWLVINGGLIAGLGNFLIKFVFDRPRPLVPHLVHAGHSSFPSGHAMGSLLFYGTFLFILPIFIKSKKTQIVIQILLLVFILLIGISRVYLGVHHPTDIIAGFLLSGAWLTITYPYFRQQKFIHQFKTSK